MSSMYNNPIEVGNRLKGAQLASLEKALRKMTGEYCRKIQFVDITADTFENLFVDKNDEHKHTYHELSKAFLEFAEGPFCHDNDRKRFKMFTSREMLMDSIEKAGEDPIGFVYHRKYQQTELMYSTVLMELYPSISEDGHITALLFIEDITLLVQKYNTCLDEGANTGNHIPGKKMILIVEDNEMNREILSAILSEEYYIIEAENGAVGLEMLQKHMLDVAVVILDVQMPVMNGYDFLKYTQKDPFLSKIPVIVATGSNDSEEERTCLKLGASDFVSKPYNAEIIRSRLANIIRLKESTATMALLQTDDRTGLYTLQAFYYHVAELIKKAPEKEYSLIIFDIDHFKLINETYGEKTGNRILQQIAGCMENYTAGSDINGRFGAARFLFLRENHSGDETDQWIRGLFDSLEKACEIKDIGFKAGIYENFDKSLPVSVICDRAIMALNSVGCNFDKRYAMYDAASEAKELRLAALEADMRSAYQNNQFSVYYQPKHDVRTGKLAGAEALIRWIHPEYGFLSPGEFIPLFERNGFVSYADYYVLKRTCSNLRTWMNEGITPVPVSVNSSRRDFAHADYVETLMKPLRDNNIDPSLIHIEVTESMFTENLDNICRMLSECREAGFRIELDDFGSGYSSLTTLAALPLDVMKLDMSFMKN